MNLKTKCVELTTISFYGNSTFSKGCGCYNYKINYVIPFYKENYENIFVLKKNR